MHPILFKIGPVSIYAYGVAVAVAFLVASYLIWRDAPSFGIARTKVPDFLIWVLVSGILGARVLHVLVNINYYKNNPLEILNLTGGGLAFYGGLFSAFAVGIWFIRKNSFPLLKTGDLIAPYLALAHAIGRIGCFLNGCCWGRESVFGIISPIDGIVRHPAQLYSALGLVVIYSVLRVFSKVRIFDGGIFIVYALLYSFFRFSIDFLRGDNPTYWMGLTASQLISLGVFVIALYFLLRGLRKGALFKSRHTVDSRQWKNTLSR